MAQKYRIFHPPDLLKLAGYALPHDAFRCIKFLAFFHHQHGTSVPSSTYNRWGIRSLGCGGSTTARVPEYVVDRPGDSGLGCTKNTS